MNQIFTTLFFCISISYTFAQSPQFAWKQRIGEEFDIIQGKAITSDAAGNSYSSGDFDSNVDFDPGVGVFEMSPVNGNGNYYLQKLTQEGAFSWALRLGTGIYVSKLEYATNGHLLISGYFYGTCDFDPGLGSFSMTSAGSKDLFLLQLDADGQFNWAKRFGDIGIESNPALKCTDTDILFSRDTITGNGQLNTILSRINYDGNVVWSKRLGENGQAVVLSIDEGANGAIFVCGSFSDSPDMDPGSNTVNLIANSTDPDFFVQKLTANGDFMWAKGYGGNGTDYAVSIAIDPDDHVYVTGGFASSVDFNPMETPHILTAMGFSTPDIYLLKLSTDGIFQWVQAFGTANSEIGRYMAVDSEGNTYLCSQFEGAIDLDYGPAEVAVSTSNNTEQLFVRKADPDGNLLWTYQTIGDRDVIPRGMKLQENGLLYITGWYNGNVAFDLQQNAPDNYAELSNAFVLQFNVAGTLSTEMKSTNDVSVFPNPGNGLVTMEITETCSVRVVNAIGQLIYSAKMEPGNHLLNLQDQADGVYFIQIELNNEIKTKRFVKG